MNTPPIRVSGFDCRRGHLSKKGFGVGLGGWGIINPDSGNRGPGVPEPLKMTHFRVFLDPFLDPLFYYLIFQGSIQGMSRKNPKKGSKSGSKKWFSGCPGPPKLDILSTKCQIWHVRFAKNWPIFGQKMGQKMGPFLTPFLTHFLDHFLSRQIHILHILAALYHEVAKSGKKEGPKWPHFLAQKWPKKWPKKWQKKGSKNGPKMVQKWVNFWTIFEKTQKN